MDVQTKEEFTKIETQIKDLALKVETKMDATDAKYLDLFEKQIRADEKLKTAQEDLSKLAETNREQHKDFYDTRNKMYLLTGGAILSAFGIPILIQMWWG